MTTEQEKSRPKLSKRRLTVAPSLLPEGTVLAAHILEMLRTVFGEPIGEEELFNFEESQADVLIDLALTDDSLIFEMHGSRKQWWAAFKNKDSKTYKVTLDDPEETIVMAKVRAFMLLAEQKFFEMEDAPSE